MRRLLLLAVMTAGCGGTSSTFTPTPEANFTGTWALQANASTSCASRLTTRDQNRTYLVTATQSAGQVTFAQIASTNPLISVTLIGIVSGNEVEGPMEIADGVLPGDVFSATGSFDGVLSENVLSGTMNGSFQTVNLSGATCFAADHRMTFTRK
jgi:hypothetical protein